MDEEDQLYAKVTAQGDLVRRLKSDKADRTNIKQAVEVTYVPQTSFIILQLGIEMQLLLGFLGPDLSLNSDF